MIKYRKAKASDWEDIKNIISFFPKVLMQEHLPRRTKFFVAIHDKKIVGCCALDIYSKRIAEIRSLAVSPNFHGKGIGTKLVELCLHRAKSKEISEIITITGKGKLFNKFGFDTFNNEKTALFKIM